MNTLDLGVDVPAEYTPMTYADVVKEYMLFNSIKVKTLEDINEYDYSNKPISYINFNGERIGYVIDHQKVLKWLIEFKALRPETIRKPFFL